MNHDTRDRVTPIRACAARTGPGVILVSAENRDALNRRIGGRFQHG